MTSGTARYHIGHYYYLVFRWELLSQSVYNNTSTISWVFEIESEISDLEFQYDEWTLTIDGVHTYKGETAVEIKGYTVPVGSVTLGQGTATISHDDDGSKVFTVRAHYAFRRYVGDEFSPEHIGDVYAELESPNGIYGRTLPQLLHPSTCTIEEADELGGSVTLSITKKFGEATHCLTWGCGQLGGTIYPETTEEEIEMPLPLDLASANTKGENVTVKYDLLTFNGDEFVGAHTFSKTYKIPDSVKPTISVSVSDATGLFDTYGAYIQNASKLNVSISAESQYGAEIVTCISILQAKRYTEQEFTTPVLEDIKGGWSVTVTDTRGKRTEQTFYLDILPYHPPVISSFKVMRCAESGSNAQDMGGNYAKVTFSAAVTSVNDLNTPRYVGGYKKRSENGYTASSYNSSEYEVVDGEMWFPADMGSSYDVRIIAADGISTTIKDTALSTGQVILHFGADGKSVGIGKAVEQEGVLDIGFLTRFFGGILPCTLDEQADFNELKTPNKYIGNNVTGYSNCPVTDGDLLLEVMNIGTSDLIKQKLTVYVDEKTTIYERIYSTAWGNWVCTSDYEGTLLWEGKNALSDNYANNGFIDLPVTLDDVSNGIVLIFVIDGDTYESYSTHFIPKKLLEISLNSGKTERFTFMMAGENFLCTKLVAINKRADDKIWIIGLGDNGGNVAYGDTMTFNNGKFVLKYILGV